MVLILFYGCFTFVFVVKQRNNLNTFFFFFGGGAVPVTSSFGATVAVES